MSVRFVLITQGVSRVVHPLLEQKHARLVGITESAPRGFSGGRRARLLWRVASRALQLLAPARSLRAVAGRRGLPYFLLHRRNLDAYETWLRERRCDLVVVSGMSHLLPQSVLRVPPLGFLNLHPSLLPAYRGPKPLFWMYYRQEPTGGVTLHFLDAGEDTGDVVFQRQCDIHPGMKSTALRDLAIGRHGVELLGEALRLLARGSSLPRLAQPQESPTPRARSIGRDEHRTLIPWESWPIERIWHVMRGTEPWLNCIDQPRGIHRGQRWDVLGYEKGPSGAARGGVKPGSVLRDDRGHFVACRDGRIRLGLSLRLSPAATSLYHFLAS